jgi:hypothetical protein
VKPLAIDLFCGLGGWAEGLLAEGWDVIGFDIERHAYGEHRYPAQLVVQDVLTLHGSQFRSVDLIVASPPCQGYSYRAMPWKRAKALPPPDNTLFEACFRIQREANEANRCGAIPLEGTKPNYCLDCMGTGNIYGHDEDGDFLDCDTCNGTGERPYIPLIVENVRGAQKWVGRARWNFGSYYLWGDVPALMPMRPQATKHDGSDWRPNGCLQSSNRMVRDGTKQAGLSGDRWWDEGVASLASRSPARKAASAMIAKIPLPLSRHIAAVFLPR